MYGLVPVTCSNLNDSVRARYLGTSLKEKKVCNSKYVSVPLSTSKAPFTLILVTLKTQGFLRFGLPSTFWSPVTQRFVNVDAKNYMVWTEKNYPFSDRKRHFQIYLDKVDVVLVGSPDKEF